MRLQLRIAATLLVLGAVASVPGSGSPAAAPSDERPRPRRPRVRPPPPPPTTPVSADEETPEEAAPTARAAAPRSPIVTRATLELSGYTDTDQVHVASPSVGLSVGNEVTGWSVSGQYLLDAVSAASVDIVSTASRRWFEYRHVGSGSLDFKAGDAGVSLGGGVSHEPDYLSIAGSARVTVDTADKNITPYGAISYGLDDVGRTGQPRSTWRTMSKWGFQAGTTFVLGRSTIASVGGDAIFERGYLAKPYRYIPLFAPGTGGSVPVGASVDEVNRLRLDLRPLDALPDARDRYALTGRLAHRTESTTFRIDQRLYRDSWALAASTTDARWMIDLGRYVMFWPHLRLHLQRAVGFWQRAYEAAPAPDGMFGVPSFRTGDRELGSLRTVTTGGGLRFYIGAAGPRSPVTLTLQGDAIYTRYFDALYITQRRALFASTLIETAFE